MNTCECPKASCKERKPEPKDKIILLEFLVETLEIDHHIFNTEPELKLGTSMVEFSLLDLPPLEFKEDILPIGRCKKCADFKSGKSCLFSVPDFPCLPQQNLEVNIRVIRELPPGFIPNKVPIATTMIDLSSVYQTLVQESRLHPYALPISKTHKECYLLTDLTGTRIAGSIGVFMRVSCYGKIIVSQFHMNCQECLFQGSPQGIHPLMYKLAGFPKKIPCTCDIYSDDQVPQLEVGDISYEPDPQVNVSEERPSVSKTENTQALQPSSPRPSDASHSKTENTQAPQPSSPRPSDASHASNLKDGNQNSENKNKAKLKELLKLN